MARPLKVFETHIGFYDLIVGAPSMKAAAAAWNVHPRIFAHGLAAPASDPEAVRAAQKHPGQVLKRLHGQKGPFTLNPKLPRPPARSKQADRAKRQRRLKEAEEKRQRRQAEKQAREAARVELADIARREATLKKRRQRLRKQFHLQGA